jgi:hypothetical protein
MTWAGRTITGEANLLSAGHIVGLISEMSI